MVVYWKGELRHMENVQEPLNHPGSLCGHPASGAGVASGMELEKLWVIW